MSQTTIFIPTAFALPQDPQSSSAKPTPAPSTGGTQGPSTGGQAPSTGGALPTTGGALPTTGATGTQQDANQKQQQPASPCGGEGMIYMMPAFLLLMYFMMIRPEQKRKKEQMALLASIKVGENVVMLSGMHGNVTALDEKTVTVRTEDGGLIKFDRSAVARVVRDEPAAAAK